MSNTKVISRSIVLICLAIVGYLICCMIGRVDRKLALIIDGIELNGQTDLTVGDRSDVCFNKVPHDYLKLSCVGDSFMWEVNKEYHDSLQYFKINNVNPNNHTIYNDPNQIISLQLSTSSGESLPIEFTGEDVWRTWENFKDQKDVLARHFATYYKLSHPGQTHQDSTKWLNQMQQHAVRSFFEMKKGKLVMVILDENTTIRSPKNLITKSAPGDTIIRYQRSGYTSSNGETSRCCKVQFFDISDYCYRNEVPEKGYFEINGVNYVVKATVKLTEWGAGHVMIKSKDEDAGRNLSISYPKPITFVGSVDTLRKQSHLSCGLITLKQDNKSFPTVGDLFLPTFSCAINFDLCNIEFSHSNDTVKVRDNNFRATVVEENSLTYKDLSSGAVPAFKKVDFHSGNDVIKCRIGFIGRNFVLSYIYLPLFVLFVLICLVWWPWCPKLSPLKLNDFYVYNPDQLKNYQWFVTMLLLTCVSYCMCKSLITLKLSYTYPYFEKLTGIMPASTALMMVFFFSLAMVLNYSFVRKQRVGNLVNCVVVAVLFCILWYMFFYAMDPAISQGMKDSYFESEVSIWSNPLEWTEMVGVNDTHRSVVYTLLLIEALILLVWFFQGVWAFAQRMSAFKTVENLIVGSYGYFVARWNALLNGVISLFAPIGKYSKYFQYIFIILSWIVVFFVCGRINWTYCWSFSLGGKIASILLCIALLVLGICFFMPFVYKAFCRTLKILFPCHFLNFLVLVVLGNISGNFSTAFITFIVIIGLSSALSSAVNDIASNKRNGKIIPRHAILCQMFFITLFYIGFAMIGDNGYLTNYLGFFMCVFVFFFVVERPDEYDTYANEQQTKKEKVWVPILIGALFVYIVALPMLTSILFSPEKVNYSRMSRRLMLYSNFNELQKSGYRYSESDAEFMVILSHYMQQDSGNDPLSNDYHYMHASVSTGQSPVVLNDLSAPIAFFGSYGIVITTIVYFALLALLTWLVLTYSFGYQDENSTLLTSAMQWRLLALLMWVGTSTYIYMSYIDWLPFTGRLNPGLGVDSVGEALETAILLAFMATVTYREEN